MCYKLCDLCPLLISLHRWASAEQTLNLKLFTKIYSHRPATNSTNSLYDLDLYSHYKVFVIIIHRQLTMPRQPENYFFLVTISHFSKDVITTQSYTVGLLGSALGDFSVPLFPSRGKLFFFLLRHGFSRSRGVREEGEFIGLEAAGEEGLSRESERR